MDLKIYCSAYSTGKQGFIAAIGECWLSIFKGLFGISDNSSQKWLYNIFLEQKFPWEIGMFST